jgi:hypothetical protein
MMNQVPSATTNAGSIWTSANNTLSSALDAWVKVEQVKAARATTGGDQVSRQVNPELQNGAGVVVDASKDQEKEKQGIKFNNPLLIGSLLLLGVGLYMRGRR